MPEKNPRDEIHSHKIKRGNKRRRLGAIYGKASQKAADFFKNITMTENLIMLVLAIIIGTLAGFGAVGIRALIKEISNLAFRGEGSLLENIAASPWYLKLAIPALGGLIIGPIIHRFAPEARGTGVPEVMHSVLLKGGHIRPRVAFFKTLVSTVTIGTGGSVGREGPIIQIGASLGSTVAQFFHIPARRMKTLVGCGAAAGIAAAFNAPVAGALFAVEIILMDFAITSFSPIVIASVMATVISHAFEGDFPAMQVTGLHYLHSFWEVNLYLVLGILSGLVSYLFIKAVYRYARLWDKKVRLHPCWKPALGGLIVGAIAIFFPQIMGVGYDAINLALNQQSMPYSGVGDQAVNALLGTQALWIMALLLVFVKIFATSMTLGSGGSGGIFAPSLFIGAMLGAFFGHFAHLAFPDITASPGTYALIAMGGLVAGTTRAPITAILTIFELTKEVSIILPLMLTCIISTIVCSRFSRESIYTMKLLLRNINIKGPAETDIMKTLYVKDIYDKSFVSIPENRDFNGVVKSVISGGVPYVSVHEIDTGKYIGLITIDNIRKVIFDRDVLQQVCIAEDIADRKVGTVTPGDDCDTAIKKMRQSRCDALPVIDDTDNRRQVGLINMQDIIDAYEQEIERVDMASDLANKILMINRDHGVRFLGGYMMTEISVPPMFVGRSIRDLQIRAKFGVDILSVKRKVGYKRSVEPIPDADYVFKPDDILIIAGKTDRVQLLESLT